MDEFEVQCHAGRATLPEDKISFLLSETLDRHLGDLGRGLHEEQGLVADGPGREARLGHGGCQGGGDGGRHPNQT